MIPSTISCIVIDTGNLISYKEFKKKASQSPSEEVSQEISVICLIVLVLVNVKVIAVLVVEFLNPEG